MSSVCLIFCENDPVLTRRRRVLVNNKEKNRLTVELPDVESDRLEAAATATGETKTRIIREALRLYFSMCVEVHEGGKIMIAKATGEMIQIRI
jgi:hypothetical protein